MNGMLTGLRPPVQQAGWIVVRMWTYRTLDVELTSDQLLQVVRLFQHYREGPPRISLENQQITWRDRRGIIFHLESGGGETTVRIRVARPLVRRGRMRGWIAAAADRLDAILRLVAGRHQVPALGSGGDPS